jgi:PcRGLX-like protein central beta sandwich domain/PcRGLX-like N-terminal RIFT barrel domain
MRFFKLISRTLIVAGIWTFLALDAGALEVKLTVSEPAGLERKGEVVTTGVPFAKGVLKDVSKLGVSLGGKAIPAQFTKTISWDDGSVRWALLDTQIDIPANGQVKLLVSDVSGPKAPAAPVKVDVGAAAIKVSTGALKMVISRKDFKLISSLKVGAQELLTAASRGLVLHKAGGGTVAAAAPTKVTLEHVGPMKAIVVLRGRFPGVHQNLLGYTARITAYAGRKYIKVHVWLENDGGETSRSKGGPKWFGFDGLEVDLGLGLGAKIKAECQGVSATGDFKVAQGANPGYDWKSMKYTITSGGEELKSGSRTDGVVSLSGLAAMTVAIRHFWQNYEKSIELKDKALKLWLWPRDGQWPRSTASRGHDSGEFAKYRKAGLYHLQGGVHKGHEIILDASGRGSQVASATISKPLMALATPQYYAGTEAAAGWFAPASFKSGQADYDSKVSGWNKCALNGVDLDPKNRGSIYYARRGGADNRGFWYGWMDFGDNLWACGYSTLHYDWTWIMMLNYLRDGNRGFLDMGTTMARHRIDVDQIWSSLDSKYYRNLTKYEKCFTSIHGGIKDGHYGPIPSHVWLSGVVLYYMITGEEKARECAINCGQGLRNRQVSKYKANPSTKGQTRSSGWTILAMCSLFDLTADKKYLDDALVLFNNHIVKQWEANGPYLVKGNFLQYYYSTQGLCELQHRTGDAKVMKLLEEGCAGSFPGGKYSEWKIFLTNIYAYVGYKKNNPAYIKKARELFCSYVPASSSPPCYRGGSGAWDKESGKMIRNGHILQFVQWKLKQGK